MIEELIINLDDPEKKRGLMSKIGSMKGLWQVTLKPRKRTRSTTANAYYFSAFVTPFLHYLREEYGDPTITKEQAHYTLVAAVLGTKETVNKRTGDVLELIPATRTKDSLEFSIYLDGAAKFLAEFCSIVVLEAEQYFESAA